MAHARRVVLAALFGLAACSVGLDPRNLERLRYGMEHQHVAGLLETDVPAVPLLRFFAEDDTGRLQDVVVEGYETAAPHPWYALTTVDGRLAAVAPVRTWYRAAPWWRPSSLWRDRENVCPWTSAQLHALAQVVVATRVELDWSALALREAEQPWPFAMGRGQAVAMSIVFVVPFLIYLPYYAYTQLFVDDGFTRAEAMRSFLLVAPAATTPAQAVAALGPPTSESECALVDGAHRVLGWRFADFAITAGFRDELLRWVDFGYWDDWVKAFMK